MIKMKVRNKLIKKRIFKQFNMCKCDKINEKNLTELIKMNLEYKGCKYEDLSNEIQEKFIYLVNNLKK